MAKLISFWVGISLCVLLFFGMGSDARNPRRWGAGEALVTVTTAVAAKGPRGLKPTSFVCNGYLSCSSNLHTHTHTLLSYVQAYYYCLQRHSHWFWNSCNYQCFFSIFRAVSYGGKVSIHCVFPDSGSQAVFGVWPEGFSRCPSNLN